MHHSIIVIVAALLSVAGCVAQIDDSFARPLDAREKTIVSATALVWSQHFRNSLYCAYYLDDMRIFYANPEQQDSLCGEGTGGCALSGHSEHDLIIVKADMSVTWTIRTIAHETIHHLNWCNGVGPAKGHDDPLIWAAPGSVEVQAWELAKVWVEQFQAQHGGGVYGN